MRAEIDRRELLAGAAAIALAGCGPASRRRKDADVIVIGAGLSGLFAAMQLEAEGFRVSVLEASQRIGGRLWTLDDLPGRPEAGGSQVGQTYARIRYAAQKTGVAIFDNPPAAREDRALFLGDRMILQSAWAGAAENPFPGAFKPLPPDAALFAASGRDNPFEKPDAWRAAARDLSAAEHLEALGFNEDARRLINVALNANDLSTYSMINVWRTLQLYAVDAAIGPTGDIENGSQRLPEAMAAKLASPVTLDARVDSVTADRAGVVVRAGTRQLAADFCILALPFPALSKIAIDPAPTGAQRDAIAGLPYTQIMQVHLEPETAFWDVDRMPAGMWTDGPLERIFPVKDKAGAIVAFTAWINGEPARTLSAQSDEAIAAIAQNELRRLRPASDGKVRTRKIVRWTQGASYAGGAYMHWAPGQVVRWASVIGAPIGPIHFAGEHLSFLHTGMEGAMEAGQAAASAVIDAASGEKA
jgi:monoamine oxidase